MGSGLDLTRRDDIIRVITRAPVPRGQHALYKALLETDGWVVGRDVGVRLFGQGAPKQWSGLVAALSKRINATRLRGEARPGLELLLKRRRTEGGPEYRALPELRAAVAMIPGLSARLARPWDEIVADRSFGEYAVSGLDAERAPDTTGAAEPLWAFIEGRARSLDLPPRLRIRWATDQAGRHESTLAVADGRARVRLSAALLEALERCDSSGWPDEIAERWDAARAGFEADPETSLNSAAMYAFGPLFQPERRVHSYNAWVHFQMHPEDVERLFGDLYSGSGWTALSVLRDLVSAAEAPEAEDDEESEYEPLVPIAELPGLFDATPEMAEHLEHTLGLAMATNGAWALLERTSLSFEFHAEYWHPPERRVLVAYLAHRWGGAFAPVEAMRAFAQGLIRHFDEGRRAGAFTWLGVDYEAMGGWTPICDALIARARTLPDTGAFAQLREVWSVTEETAAEHLIGFLEGLREDPDWPATWERSFRHRMVWMPYLGDPSRGSLRAWQDFFFAYFTALMSTNAYRTAGALAYASVLQNTPTEMMRGNLGRWVAAAPTRVKFHTVGRDDALDAPTDRASYFTVLEGLGFLALQHVPMLNGVSEGWLRAWHDPDGDDRFELMRKVGAATRTTLQGDAGLRRRLAGMFREWIGAMEADSNVSLEAVRTQRARRRADQDDDALVTTAHGRLLTEAARRRLGALDELDAAAFAAHLLLDVSMFLELSDDPEESVEYIEPDRAERVRLPAGLRAAGERALAYLRAGLHVLFAGAPGTGKTTLAQFVGYAWNHDLDHLRMEIPVDALPATTVANSSWSPFHTVGGIAPRMQEVGFRSVPGIFIDPGRLETGRWFLRPECIVLDEFNRADLDRCIGELYPLLSGSVPEVQPAGILGVRAIRTDPRFRVVATVNDATLDDIVFPISEGLARRFQRITLHGASVQDLRDFFGLDVDPPEPAVAAAIEDALSAIFTLDGDGFVRPIEGEERLPFGAGYFELVRRWLRGDLRLPESVAEASPTSQVIDLFESALATALRIPRFEEALRRRLARIR